MAEAEARLGKGQIACRINSKTRKVEEGTVETSSNGYRDEAYTIPYAIKTHS